MASKSEVKMTTLLDDDLGVVTVVEAKLSAVLLPGQHYEDALESLLTQLHARFNRVVSGKFAEAESLQEEAERWE